MRFIVIVLALGISGCAFNWQPPPPDWPKLETVYHFMDLPSVASHCRGAVGFGQVALGCVSFSPGKCHIVVPHNAPDFVVEHEKKHCEGWTH